jgi:hypothetical protein
MTAEKTSKATNTSAIGQSVINNSPVAGGAV